MTPSEAERTVVKLTLAPRDGGVVAVCAGFDEPSITPLNDLDKFIRIRERFDDLGPGDKWPLAAESGAILFEVLGTHGQQIRAMLDSDSVGPVVLEIRSDDVADLRNVPWELMSSAGTYLLSDGKIDIVRVAQSVEPVPPTRRRGGHRFRVLVVTGPNRSDNYDAKAATTVERLKRILGDVPGVDVIRAAEELSAAELSDQLRADPVDLLVFRGHADTEGLKLSRHKGRESGWVHSDTLKFTWAGKVRAAVLLACDAASGARINLARELSAAGIHTVAFQSQMHAERAEDFLEGFAGALAAGHTTGVSLPLAVRAGRVALAKSNIVEGAYARPVLWQPSGEPLQLLDPTTAGAAGTPGFLYADFEDQHWVPTRELRLESAEWGIEVDEPVLVAADGSLIGRQASDVLELARVDRTNGATRRWPDPVDLTTLGGGRVLAIGRSGREGVLFVWAGDDEATVLWRVASSGVLRRVRSLIPARAGQAVLAGQYVMVTLDGRRARRFENARIDRLVAANSGGRTVVLATGSDAAGAPGAWVEVTGRAFGRLAASDAVLVRPSGTRQWPYVLAEGERIPLDALPHDGGHGFPGPRWLPVRSDAGGARR